MSAVLAGACAAAVPAVAADADRTLVTDPAVLASMGFPADAKHVYMWKGDGSAADAPEDFGARDAFITLPPKSFMPRENPTNNMSYTGGSEGCCGNLSRATGSDTFWDAPVYLPSGALIKDFRMYVADSDAALDVSGFLFERCQPEAGGATTATTLGTAMTTATGNQAPTGLVTPNKTVDNRTCHYMMRVNMTGTTGHTLQRVRIRFARQVSPAPATATFSDVPVGSPLHRFVEALAVSGITGGCGSGLYCPNDPLTRGQMAVFLSVALGLSFE